MTMLAEVIDAVIGIGTPGTLMRWRSPIPAGRPIAAMRIGNDSAGFAQPEW
jgi:hypothetical protein